MTLCAALVPVWILFLCLFGRDESKAPKNNQTPPQPIPFSHKVHAQMALACLDCHVMPEPGWDMTYPDESKCMACHGTIKRDSPAIQKLAEYYRDHKRLPWVQVYKVPDYVFFSHKAHYQKAKIGCEVCHGPVAERDVVTKDKPTSMAACVDCHAETGAPKRCNSCHNPNP
jgi:cytochrome c7-like protein/cytochrome c3-like protein